MKPFRKHVALAVDGGGIKGVMVARALEVLEEHLGRTAHEMFRLVAGTSTGAIIAAGIASGLSGETLHTLYTELGATIFRKTWRSWLWPLTRYRYAFDPLESALREHVGDLEMGDFWAAEPPTDVVITMFDLVDNRTRFVKPWKPEYARWPVIRAVLASSSVPTYFPVVEGRYVDGGVGSYANPCYLAAYEAAFCLGWDPTETTLISLGTGRDPARIAPGQASRFRAWTWLGPLLGAFLHSADHQQVHLVNTFFPQLDFRRFQVDLKDPIAMDKASAIPLLTEYGDVLAQKILRDETDWAMDIRAARATASLR